MSRWTRPGIADDLISRMSLGHFLRKLQPIDLTRVRLGAKILEFCSGDIGGFAEAHAVAEEVAEGAARIGDRRFCGTPRGHRPYTQRRQRATLERRSQTFPPCR